MNSTPQRIVVMCPGDAVTGGPELLHQLVHELRLQGHNAVICYYPIERKFSVPKPYCEYDLEVECFEDRKNQIVVVPEVATRLLDKVIESQGVIWWLSIDNYFGRTGQGALRDLHGFLLSHLVARRKSINSLRRFEHLAQSEYARSFLRDRGIIAQLLSDYLADEHFVDRESRQRQNWIAYNPRKGAPVIRKLRRILPDLTFVPIRNMSKHQVRDLLCSVKVYVDFGHHPGKDRLPREAAIAGACVITGMRGSAGFFADVPIPPEYKLDENSPNLATQFEEVVMSIFDDFERHSAQLKSYREMIRSERATFANQVREVFRAAAKV